MLEFTSLFDETPGAAVVRDTLDVDMLQARLSWKFRSYYRVRPLLPLAIRQQLQRRRKVNVATDWFIPARFIEKLAAAFAGSAPSTIIHPWPGGARFAFVLTHDVETSEGMRLVPRLADLEEELGFRSSWNIVPFKYRTDPGLVRGLKSRGFEIGIHGYNHDGRLYTSQATFLQRAELINGALDEFGAVGFRSPMVHRNLDWLQALNIEYDASCFDVDPYQAMPGGVGGIWPFRYGRFVELPYTLPQDHTLLIAKGQRDGRTWELKLDFLMRNHGMALMLTHPDYLDTPERLAVYRDFLLHIRERGEHWHATPAELTAWWKRRAQSRIVVDEAGNQTVEGPAGQSAVITNLEFDDGVLTLTPAATSAVNNRAGAGL